MNFNFTNQNEYDLNTSLVQEMINLYGVQTKFLVVEEQNVDEFVFGDFSHLKTDDSKVFEIYMLPETSEDWDSGGYNFTEYGSTNFDNVVLFAAKSSFDSIFPDDFKLILGCLVVFPNQKIMEITDVDPTTSGINNLFTYNDAKSVYKLTLKPYAVKLIDELDNFDTSQSLSTPNTVPTDMISHYTFDNITDSIVADEMGLYPCTLINSPTIVSGHLSNAVQLDNSLNQYVDAGLAMTDALGDNVSALAISLWFKAQDPTIANQGIFSIGNLTDVGLLDLILSEEILTFNINGSEVASEIVDDTTTYHHCVIQYTGSKLQLFLDNVNVDEIVYATNLDLVGLKTLIGTYKDGSFSGEIDQIRIFDRELTLTEIEQLYEDNGAPQDIPYEGLDVYFNELINQKYDQDIAMNVTEEVATVDKTGATDAVVNKPIIDNDEESVWGDFD